MLPVRGDRAAAEGCDDGCGAHESGGGIDVGGDGCDGCDCIVFDEAAERGGGCDGTEHCGGAECGGGIGRSGCGCASLRSFWLRLAAFCNCGADEGDARNGSASVWRRKGSSLSSLLTDNDDFADSGQVGTNCCDCAFLGFIEVTWFSETLGHGDLITEIGEEAATCVSCSPRWRFTALLLRLLVFVLRRSRRHERGLLLPTFRCSLLRRGLRSLRGVRGVGTARCLDDCQLCVVGGRVLTRRGRGGGVDRKSNGDAEQL